LNSGAGGRGELLLVAKYTNTGFAEDFNRHLRSQLRNISLSFDNPAALKVDGLEFMLKQSRLEAYSSRAVLRTELHPARDIPHIFADGRAVSTEDAKFFFWFNALERQSWVVCKMGKHQFLPHLFSALRESAELPPKID